MRGRLLAPRQINLLDTYEQILPRHEHAPAPEAVGGEVAGVPPLRTKDHKCQFYVAALGTDPETSHAQCLWRLIINQSLLTHL